MRNLATLIAFTFLALFTSTQTIYYTDGSKPDNTGSNVNVLTGSVLNVDGH
jgi:hypothetical protein